MRKESLTEQRAPLPATELTGLQLEQRFVPTDAQGFLLNVADWGPDVTEAMADADGVELTADHWLLIEFLHRFYSEYDLVPDLHVLSRNMCKDQQECRWKRKYINRLFPLGSESACRYAGLPAPLGRGCI